MKKYQYNIFLSIIIPVISAGCLEEISDLDKIQDFTWNSELALPVGNSSFGLTEFLENDSINDYVETDENGLIIFTYHDQFQSQDAASYIEIPDETYRESFSFDAPLLLQLPIQKEISKTETFRYTLANEEGDEIDSALLSAGSLELILQADFPASGEATFIFHSAFENGLPLQRTYSWTYTGVQPALDEDDIIDLNEIKFDLTDGGTSTNLFKFDVDVRLFYEGQPVLSDNSLEMNVKLLNAEFDEVYGKIATREISSDQESIQLDFFENILDGSFYLDEPTITLEFGNSFGIPAGVRLNNLSATNGTQTELLSGSITSSLQEIDAPDITQAGEIVNTTIVIDKTNSNLPDIISLLPTEITYQLDGILNPNGLKNQSFVLGESVLDINLNIELPLIGKASNLRIEQDFDLNGPDVFDDFNYALIQISVENDFPIGTILQFYFMDQFGQTLDELISETDQRIIAAAQVDSEGLVTEPTIKVTQIELEKSKIDLIKDTRNLKLEAKFNTSGNGNVSVKILDSYKLKIKIGVQTEFNITLDL